MESLLKSTPPGPKSSRRLSTELLPTEVAAHTLPSADSFRTAVVWRAALACGATGLALPVRSEKNGRASCSDDSTSQKRAVQTAGQMTRAAL